MPVINGWTVLAHPLLLDQLEKLTSAVEKEKRKAPDGFRHTANAKLLAALTELILVKVPHNPAAAAYLQGGTLGPERRHWFRAKFGAGRFRLFFRYSSRARVIIFAWVNDAQSLRTYGAKTDAYAVFRSMLATGNPPDGWDDLLKQAESEAAQARFGSVASGES